MNKFKVAFSICQIVTSYSQNLQPFLIIDELIFISSFWKSNQTIVNDWTSRFSNLTAYPDFESLDYDSLFDPTKKTEPAEEYWL